MAKIKDLSPKLKGLRSAEDEIRYQLPPGEVPIGQRQGGLEMYSNKFKRGYGDLVFGNDDNGIWLGAAEFADAPFSVDYEGNMIASSATLGDYLTKAGTDQGLTGSIDVGGSGSITIDGVNVRIIMNDGSDDRLLIGDDGN